jgi:hypothetical protein
MTDPDNGNKKYRVGYGRPPREHQFKKGEPQEFRRRAKKRATRRETLVALANRLVALSDKGKTRKVTADEAVFLQLLNQAAKGNPRAIALWIKHVSSAVDASEVVESRSEQDGVEARKRITEKIEQMARHYAAEQAAKEAAESTQKDKRAEKS